MTKLASQDLLNFKSGLRSEELLDFKTRIEPILDQYLMIYQDVYVKENVKPKGVVVKSSSPDGEKEDIDKKSFKSATSLGNKNIQFNLEELRIGADRVANLKKWRGLPDMIFLDDWYEYDGLYKREEDCICLFASNSKVRCLSWLYELKFQGAPKKWTLKLACFMSKNNKDFHAFQPEMTVSSNMLSNALRVVIDPRIVGEAKNTPLRNKAVKIATHIRGKILDIETLQEERNVYSAIEISKIVESIKDKRDSDGKINELIKSCQNLLILPWYWMIVILRNCEWVIVIYGGFVTVLTGVALNIYCHTIEEGDKTEAIKNHIDSDCRRAERYEEVFESEAEYLVYKNKENTENSFDFSARGMFKKEFSDKVVELAKKKYPKSENEDQKIYDERIIQVLRAAFIEMDKKTFFVNFATKNHDPLIDDIVKNIELPSLSNFAIQNLFLDDDRKTAFDQI